MERARNVRMTVLWLLEHSVVPLPEFVASPLCAQEAITYAQEMPSNLRLRSAEENLVSSVILVCFYCPSTSICRNATFYFIFYIILYLTMLPDDCDVAESCTGNSYLCPADGFLPSTTICRNATGACDIAERCTGASAKCPVDVVAPKTQICRDIEPGSLCDVAEFCTGSTTDKACPANAFKPSSVSGKGYNKKKWEQRRVKRGL